MNLIKTNFEKEFPGEIKYVWKDEKSYRYLQSRAKALLAKLLFGNNGFFRSLNEQDQIMARALSILKTGEYSKIINGQRK